MKKFTKEDVLWATMTNTTPLGAIIDRLASRYKIRKDSINRDVIIEIITFLIYHKLVIRIENRGSYLYRKIPWAMKALGKILDAQELSN